MISEKIKYDYCLSDVILYNHYYPFGQLMPGRHTGGSDYRYGFGGMEKTDEVAGEGNSYTAEFWQYDARLGRRWEIDPIVKPWESPYAAFSNNPIIFIDPLGLRADWYEDENQNIQWVDSKEDFDTKTASGEITGGKYLGKSTWSYDPDGGWTSYNEDGTKVSYYASLMKDAVVTGEKPAPSCLSCELRGMAGKVYSGEALKEAAVGMYDSFWEMMANAEYAFNQLKGNNYRDPLEGYDDMGNSGGVSWERGKKIMAATVGIILTGGTIYVLGQGGFFAYASLGANVDDLTSQDDGSTLFSKVTGMDIENLNKIKFVITLGSLKSSTQDMITDFAANPGKYSPSDVMQIFNVVNGELQSLNGLNDQIDK